MARFEAQALVVSAGFDTVRGDPMGTFRLEPEDYRSLGKMIAGLGLPTLVIQEGGYLVSTLGKSVSGFLVALEGA